MRPLRRLTAILRRALTRTARVCWSGCRRGWWPTVELAGAALLCLCVGLYEPRLAVGLAGLMLLAVSNFRPPRRPPRP
jgi:hypothetical protein